MAAAYDAEESNLFARALGAAWQQLTEARKSEDEALIKAALSHGILHAADMGERNEQVLVAYALANLESSKREIKQRMDGDGGKNGAGDGNAS